MSRASKSLLLAAALLAGCASRQEAPRQDAAAVGAPQGFSAAGARADAKWIEAFADPALLELVARARAANPDLTVARARQREAEATLFAATGVNQPKLSAQAGFESSVISGQTGRVPPGIPRRTDVAGVGLKASWELDFWGRNSSKAEAADKEVRAAEYSVAQADLALVSEVARLWFAVRSAREQQVQLEQEFAARFREMEIVQRSVDAGVLASDPLSSAKLAAAQAKVDEGLGRRRLAAAENALRALLNLGPSAPLPVGKPGAPAMPSFGPGVPSDLLKQRPDLAAAAARFDAAVAREGSAVADFYPSVTLTGQAGWQADPASKLGRGNSGFWSLAPAIDLPLFDGANREATLAITRARISGADAEWRKAVFNAFREVEDALVDLRELALQEELTKRVADAVTDRRLNAEARFKAGVANESEVVVARRDEAMALRTLSSVVWERRQAVVRLAAATGGGWSAK